MSGADTHSAGPGASGLRHPEPAAGAEAQLSALRHSLRTPLNQIIGYSEMLLEEASELGLESHVADLGKIRAAGGQLLVLVNERLGTPRVMAGQLDVEELRRDARTLLNLIVGYSELCLECVDRGGSQVAEDLTRIRTASDNLLKLLSDPGAFRWVPRGGVASVVAGLRDGAANAERRAPDLAPVAAPMVGRLLVVDDNEMNRDMLSRRLERLGHKLILAENGRQALEKLRSEPVDVILLDILMPEMDGLETLERIKADPALKHVPVIMLSALDELDSVVRCIEVGADDYVQKPFNPVLLKARIGACLEKKRLRDQEQAFLLQLQTAQEKAERLLLNVLPGSIADRLKEGETNIADNFADVTVLFADLVEFTRLAANTPAAQLVKMLNEIFSQFDWLAEIHRLEKIKTIGDAYMVVGGLPVPRVDHAEAVAAMAVDMLKAVAELNAASGSDFNIRVGISTGPVVAGIIGSKKFIYDLWGDTVNIASRMESQGQMGQVHVSQSTYERLKDRYHFEDRGRIEIKGKGAMNTYFLGPRR